MSEPAPKRMPAKLYRYLDQAGELPPGTTRVYPQAHFCPDWDYLLIYTSPETDGCTCFTGAKP